MNNLELTQFVDQTWQLDGVPLVDPHVRRLRDELWDGVDDALVLIEVIVVGGVVVVVVGVVVVADGGVRIGVSCKRGKFEIYNSGFPKKACQGCHISEGAGRIIF